GRQEWTPTRGTPQGAVFSPLAGNLYLHPLDVWMRDRGYEMVRYADDAVVLCRTADEAHQALEHIQRWVESAGLTLHAEKTRIVNVDEPGGFDFLGYHFERGYRWPRKSSVKKFKDAIRARTRRTHGHSLSAIIANVNRTTRGWFGYFQPSHGTTFGPLDGWLRMRLRSILRRRIKLRGRGRGADHQRWPNAYFAREGLFTMVEAYRLARQSVAAH
ncbi:MAG: reverse transcriptase domain-containing protein, partial [Planctomycetota bacterium]